MEESDELNPLHRDSVQMIVASGDLLRAVVDDVLDYSVSNHSFVISEIILKSLLTRLLL